MTTQAPELIKLKTAGTSLAMRVAFAEQVPVGKYPEYAFIGESVGGQGPRAVELRVPKASADRQLGRMELVLADTIGKTLLFSRDENANDAAKPFWGITLVSGANGDGGKARVASTPAASLAQPSGSSPAPSAQPASAAKEKDKELHGYALYRAITEKVLADLVGLYVDAGVPIDSQTVAAISATIFIQAERR